MAATKTMPITGDPASDRLLMTDPLALLLGMLLDQQVPDGVGLPGTGHPQGPAG